MNGQLERRLTALETKAPNGQAPFLILFGDESIPAGSDGRKVVRIPWLNVDVAKARGWR
jgi:hypothetical protein